ncbi:hypothetical protein [Paludibacterium denitrificans]|uniref:Cellulose synthase operon protein C n=1 Tax=Paludibacterium denitrificans TaxID=2675226 RepID=A0A844GBD8_9NEIS|nr:hypothetical protein [Paludibacterium denitrificans]MTD33082.1 hypothetical protein [Paludibacterium denitrificans]
MKKNLLPCLLAGLFSVGVSVHAAELPRWKQADYVAAIQAARAGQPSGALQLLEQERQKGALPTPLLDDYLTLLCWDGRSVEALRQWKAQPDPALTPTTLGLLARKARDQHDYALAQQLYRTVLNSHPTSDASAGPAMTQADAGQLPQALATLAAAGKPATRADELELARARSYVLVQGGDLTAGLSNIRAAMQRFPGDRELARTYVTLLLKLGAPGEAHRFIRQSGGVDRTLDVQTELDQAAVTSRWGVTQESLETGTQRYQLTDLALQQNQIVSEQLRPDEQRFRDGALNDRLIMLQQRDRSAEVIRDYEQHQPFTLNKPIPGQRWLMPIWHKKNRNRPCLCTVPPLPPHPMLMR